MATYVYDDFRVTFTPRADRDFDVRACDADGAIAVGTFTLPLSEAELETAILEVAPTRAATRRARRQQPILADGPTRDVGGDGPPVMDVERLGRLLGDALFSGDVGSAYERARQRAEGRSHGIRLSLDLGKAPALLSVPWEFVYRPPRFLASQRRSPLVRVLDAAALSSPPTIEGVVRVLGVVASPHDLPPLDVEAERRRVDQALSSAASLGRVELTWLEPATPRSLRQALRDGMYHIVHYVGHSDFTEHGDGIIYLEDQTGGAAKVDETLFANLLSDQDVLRLVVLNSCEGARTTLTDAYAGVATTLIRLGVPAVVAMQFEISDQAAILFAEELYTNLIVRQDPIDAAIGEARKAILAEVDKVEWATPVLFVSDPDIELFRFRVDVPAEVPPLDPPGAPDPEVVASAGPAVTTPGSRGRILVAAAVAVAATVIGLLVARSGRGGSLDAVVAVTTTTQPESPTAQFPSVPIGSEGDVVEVIQHLLNHRGFPVPVTGFFDDATLAAVQAFEESEAIPADGLVGRLTWQQLVVPVKRGQESDAVRAMQILLVANGVPTEPDGRFTLDVQDDVIAFQRANGLAVDGIGDVETWRTLLAGAASAAG